MVQRKTNESVKAGLLTESGGQTGVTGKETETKETTVDEVIHQPDFEPTALFNKTDNNGGLQTNSSGERTADNGERDRDNQGHGK
ncbi:MAG: hypothetical protein ABIO79_16975 [Ferruginibacter sp.]